MDVTVAFTRPRLARFCWLLWWAPALACAAGPQAQSNPVFVRSPDGRLQVELYTRAAAGSPARLQYRVSLSNQIAVAASNLGVRLKDGTELGRDCEVVGSETVAIDTSFEQFPGKRRHVIDRATETTVTLRERGAKALEWRMVLRAYDDGVALRYRFSKQPGWSDLELEDEEALLEPPRRPELVQQQQVGRPRRNGPGCGCAQAVLMPLQHGSLAVPERDRARYRGCQPA